jgi:electron transport complex protein RnfB
MALMEAITTSVPGLIVGLLLFFAAAATWIQRRIPKDETALADRIESLLPLTQCAQCGHPGCRPYAEAVAEGAAIDLCPPGGPDLVAELKDLMGDQAPVTSSVTAPEPTSLVAVIDPAACIGCTLCLDPCPVDAIVGAQGFMHTVIEKECTGCELCIAPCPVDCISLVAVEPPKAVQAPPLIGKGCINCGQCIDACPVALAPDQLLKLSAAEDWEAAEAIDLQRCIECKLCDRVCPSEINLAARFGYAKHMGRTQRAETLEKNRIKARFEAHETRLIARQSEADQRRAKRLARLRPNPSPAEDADKSTSANTSSGGS